MKRIALALSCLCVAFSLSSARADEKMKMYFNNEDLTRIIELYSKASGQKFVIDPNVRGKVSILIQEPVTMDEAFNQLSSALAINGFAISKQGDTMIVKSARNIQRDLIEVGTEKPALKPERMCTWIYTPKYLSADWVNMQIRVLLSRDGELSVLNNTNQLIFADWASNLNRVSEILKDIDKPVDAATAKIVEAAKKEREAHRKEKDQLTRKEEKKEKSIN